MRATGYIGLLSALPLAIASSQAIYLERNELLCDDDKIICLRGSLSYEPNPRLLRLRGRVQFAPGPGTLQIMLTGTNRKGDKRYAPMEVRLRGKYSEIVDFKMIPDHPDVANWEIDRIEFRREADP